MVDARVVAIEVFVQVLAFAEDSAREAGRRQSGRFRRTKRVLHVDSRAFRETKDVDGTVSYARLVPVHVRQHNVLVLHDALRTRDRDLTLPHVATSTFAFELGGLVDVTGAETLGRAYSNDTALVDAVVDRQLDRHGSALLKLCQEAS